jgi:hypothetical protein
MKIPKGLNVFKKVLADYGNYKVIASNKKVVYIFTFDGVSENPVFVEYYKIMK